MQKDLYVREANKEDENRVVNLLCDLMLQHSNYDSFYETCNNLEDAFRDEFLRILNNEDGCFLVAVNDNEIIGVLSFEILFKPAFFKYRKYGYIIAGIVKESYRNTGVMYLLYQESVNWFKLRDVKYIELDVHIANSESLSFTKKQGFKEYKSFFRKAI